MKLIRYEHPAVNELDKFFALNLPTFGRFQELGKFFEPQNGSHKTPATDIHEDEQNYYITMEVPGIQKDDIDLNLENSVLTLSAETQDETEGRKRSFSFTKSVTVPDDTEAENIKAKLEHGVLTINLPKGKKSKARQITVG